MGPQSRWCTGHCPAAPRPLCCVSLCVLLCALALLPGVLGCGGAAVTGWTLQLYGRQGPSSPCYVPELSRCPGAARSGRVWERALNELDATLSVGPVCAPSSASRARSVGGRIVAICGHSVLVLWGWRWGSAAHDIGRRCLPLGLLWSPLASSWKTTRRAAGAWCATPALGACRSPGSPAPFRCAGGLPSCPHSWSVRAALVRLVGGKRPERAPLWAVGGAHVGG